MSRLLHEDRTEIFKFKETGLGAAIEEAYNYILELRGQGVVLQPDEVIYKQDLKGNHYFVFWGM